MMRFEQPLMLFLLAVVPLLFRFGYREGRARRTAVAYTDLGVLGDRVRTKNSVRAILFWVRVLAIVALIFALARPQLEHGYETVETEGIDIMLALDISGSMRAEDFKPRNRLFVAKQVVGDFVSRISTDRVGLVAFAGKSFTRCPLTLDYGVLKSLLEGLDVGLVEDGTAIGLALANSVARLKDSEAESKIIILLTDGVNNRGEIDPPTGAQLAAAADIRVYTIGVGKQGGAPVPVVTPDGRKVYARNPDGSLYMTELDEDTLKDIAERTGGRYYRATDEQALDEIYQRILEMEKTAFRIKSFRHRTEVARYVLPAGLAVLFVEILLLGVVWRKIP
jgi:Ca-activated chloride channel family protein